jgi:hypothetical protein
MHDLPWAWCRFRACAGVIRRQPADTPGLLHRDGGGASDWWNAGDKLDYAGGGPEV